ncbi:efflux RND transporter periplasmic adaptor subunit [Galbibacter sp. EGI 63066]|uniref:efflux RND transporter periplasmic adaptor subunit n=1 Tax=Galbibacter sp. EGI 63066 TaxID=2993559 RepID=UPI0022493888|nr:efflux RND transporter periplasmic adaptor subunit [Galbibacter sp. EGI 63066]MCX2680586.1 efflux RND transporter periplasmic adaptor subunit [Galbibacter sp. EGI 63066]
MRSKLFLICVAVVLSSCRGKQEQQQAQQQAMPFPTVKIEKRDVTTQKSYPTSIQGVVSSEIRPKVTGYIQDVLVDEGENVKKGQLLFRLETQSLSQDAGAAKASVNVAQVEVEKLKPLVAKGIISNVQLETAKANLAQAKSNYNSITANIGYASVRSPVDGVVGSIPYRKGALVSATTQTPLTTVSSIESVYAFFSMNEKDFITLMKNVEGKSLEEKAKNLPKISLILADGSTYEEEGTIETISGNIDPQTGTVSLRATFKNPVEILRSGSSGTVRVPQHYEGALIVPSISTFEQQGKRFVYKVAENDSIYESALIPLDETDKFVVVKSGVNEGDAILAKGVNKVRTGAKIVPQPMSLDSLLNSFETVFK